MRLIDADALLQTLSDLCCADNNVKTRQIIDLTLHDLMPQVISDEPTVDAQPVKRGNWKQDASGELYCPYCMYVPQWDDDKFCAHCGAKMCGGDSDGDQV